MKYAVIIAILVFTVSVTTSSCGRGGIRMRQPQIDTVYINGYLAVFDDSVTYQFRIIGTVKSVEWKK